MERRGERWLPLLFLLLVAAVAAGNFVAGLPPQLTFYYDPDIPLDFAWRLHHGQTPHRDFSTPLGPLLGWLTWAGYAVRGPCASALTYGTTAFGVALALVAYGVARTRISGWPAFVFAVTVLLLVVGARTLGYPPRRLSAAVVYNRLGEAMLGVQFLLALLPRRTPGRWGEWADGVLFGVLLALQLLDKVTFFALGLAVLALVHDGAGRWRVVALAVCVGLLVGLCVATRFDPRWWLDDLQLAGRAQSAGGRLGKLPALVSENLVPLALVTGLSAWAALAIDGFDRTRFLLAGAVAVGGALLLGVTGTQLPYLPQIDMPLCAFAATALVAAAERGCVLPTGTRQGAWVAAAALLVNLAARDGASLAYAWGWAATTGRDWPADRLLDSPAGRDFVMAENDAFLRQVQDGLALLRKHGGDRGPVWTLDFSNPFPFLLGTPPPRGPAVWSHADVTFNRAAHLPAERVFGDVEWLMASVVPYNTASRELLWDLYGDHVTANYEKVDVTPYWTLWRRRGAR